MTTQHDYRRKTDVEIAVINEKISTHNDKLDEILKNQKDMNDKLFGIDTPFSNCKSHSTAIFYLKWVAGILVGAILTCFGYINNIKG